MTSGKDIHPAIPAFTVEFRLRQTGKESIRAWIAAKRKVRRTNSIRKWLNAEIARAETALDDLKPIKTHPDVGLARRNARAHRDWATATKAELLRMYPSARSKFVPKRRGRRPNRLRVGSLGRETQVFAPRKPKDDS